MAKSFRLRRRGLALGLTISFLLFLASLELLSYVFVSQLGFFGVSPEDIVRNLNEDWKRSYLETRFDPYLGWQYKPDYSSHPKKNGAGELWQFTTDALGARRNVALGASHEPHIATFGDSFTFGDEVNDDETWQHHLGQELGLNVANYGVGGYGTGQAVLRFERELQNGLRPEIAILGIWKDNFQRAVNRFRPFFYVQTGIKLGFKPRFYVDETGALRLLESVLQSPVYDSDELLHHVAEARQMDRWSRYHPGRKFPYAISMLRLSRIRICDQYQWIPYFCRGLEKPAWNHQDIGELMLAIVGRFVDGCEEKGIKPVILFIEAIDPAPWARFRDLLEKEMAGRATVLDSSEALAPHSGRIRLSREGHFSATGNRLLAQFVARELRSAGLTTGR